MSPLHKAIADRTRELRLLKRRRDELGYGHVSRRDRAPITLRRALAACQNSLRVLKTEELKSRVCSP